MSFNNRKNCIATGLWLMCNIVVLFITFIIVYRAESIFFSLTLSSTALEFMHDCISRQEITVHTYEEN